MAIVSKNMTVKHTPIKRVRAYNALEGTGEAGTFSGSIVTTAASSAATNDINDRWQIFNFADAATNCAVWNHILPGNYVENDTGLEVEIKWTSDDSTTGNVALLFGLTSLDSASIYAIDNETQFTRATLAAPGSLNLVMSHSVFIKDTFGPSASQIDNEKPISFILIREGAAGADDIGGTFKVLDVSFKWYENQEGINV